MDYWRRGHQGVRGSKMDLVLFSCEKHSPRTVAEIICSNQSNMQNAIFVLSLHVLLAVRKGALLL